MLLKEGNTKKRPRILIISGIDPTGAAGFTLDVSLAAYMGAAVSGVPTCLVAENYRTVSDLQPARVEVFVRSIELSLEEGNFAAVKIGLIPVALIEPLINTISANRSNFGKVIVDPVLFSSSGFVFHQSNAIEFKKILTIADLLTPNLEEFKTIFKGKETDTDELLRTSGASILITSFRKTSNFIYNLLISKDTKILFKTKRFPFEVRGTGCALSTLIACYSAYGCEIDQAVKKSMSTLNKLIKKAEPLPGKNLKRIVLG